MIGTYLLKLAIVLPLIAGLAVATIWGWRKVQPMLGQMPGSAVAQGPVRLIDTITLGTAGRLAVVEFGGRQLLLAVNRTAIACLAEQNLTTDQPGD